MRSGLSEAVAGAWGDDAAAGIPAAWEGLPRGSVVLLRAGRALRDERWVARDDEGAPCSVEAIALAARAAVSLAHDLQGPLTAAIGNLELLNDDAAPDVARRLEHTAGVLRQLAAAQSLRARRLPMAIDRGPSPAGDALEAALAAVEGEFRRRRVPLASPRPTAGLALPASEDVAVAALAQLAENALFAAVLRGGAVSIALRESADAVELCVDDEGPGLTDEARARVGTEGWSTRGSARGYGLWALRAVAARVRGAVALAPREGRGLSARLGLRR